MKILIDISDHLYKCLQTRIKYNAQSEIDNIVAKGQVLPDDCEILTKDAYSELCLRAAGIIPRR